MFTVATPNAPPVADGTLIVPSLVGVAPIEIMSARETVPSAVSAKPLARFCEAGKAFAHWKDTGPSVVGSPSSGPWLAIENTKLLAEPAGMFTGTFAAPTGALVAESVSWNVTLKAEAFRLRTTHPMAGRVPALITVANAVRVRLSAPARDVGRAAACSVVSGADPRTKTVPG